MENNFTINTKVGDVYITHDSNLEGVEEVLTWLDTQPGLQLLSALSLLSKMEKESHVKA